jgi:hypothetical protein
VAQAYKVILYCDDLGTASAEAKRDNVKTAEMTRDEISERGRLLRVESHDIDEITHEITLNGPPAGPATAYASGRIALTGPATLATSVPSARPGRLPSGMITRMRQLPDDDSPHRPAGRRSFWPYCPVAVRGVPPG